LGEGGSKAEIAESHALARGDAILAGMNTPQPAGVDLQDSRSRLVVSWSDESQTCVAYRALRLACKCALCVDELSGKPLLDPSTVPEGIGVDGCQEVGLYGLQFRWTDGHGTGIYTWTRLRELGSHD
jgi:ATP-binding protein involved in chromosome partitioning